MRICFLNPFDVRLRIQQRRQAVAHNCVIVG